MLSVVIIGHSTILILGSLILASLIWRGVRDNVVRGNYRAFHHIDIGELDIGEELDIEGLDFEAGIGEELDIEGIDIGEHTVDELEQMISHLFVHLVGHSLKVNYWAVVEQAAAVEQVKYC